MAEPTVLILAAGRSTRMRGADKLMEPIPAPFGQVPLLEAVARRAVQAGTTRVVLGPGQEDRADLLRDLNLKIVEAPPNAGMAASIATGVVGLTGSVLVVLGDMPEIRAADLHLMLTLSLRAPKAILRAAAPDGAPGHPVLFPRDLIDELSTLTGDQGARDVLRDHADRVHFVTLADRRALIDLDTPEDWAAWRSAQNHGGKT